MSLPYSPATGALFMLAESHSLTQITCMKWRKGESIITVSVPGMKDTSKGSWSVCGSEGKREDDTSLACL